MTTGMKSLIYQVKCNLGGGDGHPRYGTVNEFEHTQCPTITKTGNLFFFLLLSQLKLVL